MAASARADLARLDLARSLLAVVKAQGERLSDQEAALFLPALVDKSGHAMEAAREKFRAVLRLVPGVFPASRAAGYYVRGLDSKNTKTRLEMLDALELLMERHGLDVVERGGSKAMAEVAKLADARDAPTRCSTRATRVATATSDPRRATSAARHADVATRRRMVTARSRPPVCGDEGQSSKAAADARRRL